MSVHSTDEHIIEELCLCRFLSDIKVRLLQLTRTARIKCSSINYYYKCFGCWDCNRRGS